MQINRFSVGWAGTIIVTAVSLFIGTNAWAQNLRAIHGFCNCPNNGFSPIGGLVFDNAGNLYGTTTGGGSLGYGAVYQLIPQSDGAWVSRVIHSFDPNGIRDGFNPEGTLIIDSEGNLYGTTANGGQFGGGTVFELIATEAGWHERLLHSFSGYDGSSPISALTFDSSGNLFGTTLEEGANSNCYEAACGTVFELLRTSNGGWIEKTIHNFANDGADGYGPTSGVIVDAAGNLYGTTQYGGGSTACSNGCGVVFKFSPGPGGRWTETILHSFQGPEGDFPMAPLTLYAGALYGTTEGGGTDGAGTVFQLSSTGNGGWTYTVLHSFLVNGVDGYYPLFGALIRDSSGNLYGTTYEGGSDFYGAVYELTSSGGLWDETVLSSFADGNGEYPKSGLVFDQLGNLYGTTNGGGAAGKGVVFELTP